MSKIVIARIVRIMPAVLLLFSSHAVAAQEAFSDTERLVAGLRIGASGYQADVRTRAMELNRKIEVLGCLAEAADSLGQRAAADEYRRELAAITKSAK